MAAAPLANGTTEHELPRSNGNVHENGSKKIKEAERRRRRRKQKKKGASNGEEKASAADSEDDSISDSAKMMEEQVQVEYILEKPNLDESYGPLIEVFEKLSSAEKLFPLSTKDENSKQDVPLEKSKLADSDDEDEEEQDVKLKEKGMSNKKKKLARRMKIAELKQQCSKPDVVEVWDATAADPKLLVFLKAYRNTVPVPRHWCQKRKFLQDAALQQS